MENHIKIFLLYYIGSMTIKYSKYVKVYIANKSFIPYFQQIK